MSHEWLKQEEGQPSHEVEIELKDLDLSKYAKLCDQLGPGRKSWTDLQLPSFRLVPYLSKLS